MFAHMPYYTYPTRGLQSETAEIGKIFSLAKTFCIFRSARGRLNHISCQEKEGDPLKIIDRIALILVIIGALNWGSVGVFAFDCVAFICGGQLAALSRIIYALVGIAGLWCITLLFRERDSEE